MSSTKNVRSTVARQIAQRRNGPEAHDPETNRHGMCVPLNATKINKTNNTRGVFTKFVTLQQMDREMLLKHTILMTRLIGLDEASVLLIVPLLRKIGELHWRLTNICYEEAIVFGGNYVFHR